jgi:hypothetical protein
MSELVGTLGPSETSQRRNGATLRGLSTHNPGNEAVPTLDEMASGEPEAKTMEQNEPILSASQPAGADDSILGDAAGLYDRYVELSGIGRFTAESVKATDTATRWTPQPLGLVIGGPRWDTPLGLRLTGER